MEPNYPRSGVWIKCVANFLQLAAVAEQPAAKNGLRQQWVAIREKLERGLSLAECYADAVAEGTALPFDEFCCFLRDIAYEIYEARIIELKAIGDDLVVAKHVLDTISGSR